MARIFSVHSVQLQLLKSNPVQILVVAQGTATTSGWKNIALVPIDGSADADRILDFDFVGDPPTGISLPVLSPVQADFVIADAEKILGVVVNARTNSQTAMLPGQQAAPAPAGLSAAALQATQASFTTFAIGEEGNTTFAAQFAESPPLTPHVEKMALRTAETLALIPSESWVPHPAEKLALGTAEKFMVETTPVTDLPPFNTKFSAGGGEGGPGPDPIGPMFFSPFGVR